VRQVWDAAEQDWIFLPAAGRWQRKASATNSDRLASLQAEFAAALDEMKRQAERAHKLETKARPPRHPPTLHPCTFPRCLAPCLCSWRDICPASPWLACACVALAAHGSKCR